MDPFSDVVSERLALSPNLVTRSNKVARGGMGGGTSYDGGGGALEGGGGRGGPPESGGGGGGPPKGGGGGGRPPEGGGGGGGPPEGGGGPLDETSLKFNRDESILDLCQY